MLRDFARFPLITGAEKMMARFPHRLVETPMEPEWSRKVPSWLVCDWFYALFVITATVSAAVLLLIIYLFAASKGGFKDGIKIFLLITQLVLGTTSALFYYLICDRALKPTY